MILKVLLYLRHQKPFWDNLLDKSTKAISDLDTLYDDSYLKEFTKIEAKFLVYQKDNNELTDCRQRSAFAYELYKEYYCSIIEVEKKNRNGRIQVFVNEFLKELSWRIVPLDKIYRVNKITNFFIKDNAHFKEIHQRYLNEFSSLKEGDTTLIPYFNLITNPDLKVLIPLLAKIRASIDYRSFLEEVPTINKKSVKPDTTKPFAIYIAMVMHARNEPIDEHNIRKYCTESNISYKSCKDYFYKRSMGRFLDLKLFIKYLEDSFAKNNNRRLINVMAAINRLRQEGLESYIPQQIKIYLDN